MEQMDGISGEKVRGFIFDVMGTICISGKNRPFPKAVEAVESAYKYGKVRIVSNHSDCTPKELCARLQGIGFGMIRPEDIWTPIKDALGYLQSRPHLRPHLCVKSEVVDEFRDCVATNGQPPDCVVFRNFEKNFDKIDDAYRVLLNSPNPLLITLGSNKSYNDPEKGRCLGYAAYAEAIVNAVTDPFSNGKKCEHVVLGKSDPNYFLRAVKDMGLKPEQVVMIGDDIEPDVCYASRAGIRGCLVRTGRWMPEWENHPTIRPFLIGDNPMEIVQKIMEMEKPKKMEEKGRG